MDVKKFVILVVFIQDVVSKFHIINTAEVDQSQILEIIHNSLTTECYLACENNKECGDVRITTDSNHVGTCYLLKIRSVCKLSAPCKVEIEYCEVIPAHPGYQCVCKKKGFSGDLCEVFTGAGSNVKTSSSSCEDIKKNYPNVTSGIYWISNESVPVEHFCNFGGWSNVALNKPAQQSSMHKEYDAGNAFDGNTNQKLASHSCSHTTDFLLNPWLQVDLQERFFISSIKIYNRNDIDYLNNRFQNVDLVISDSENATVNRQICTHINKMPDPVTEVATFPCTNVCNGRYVRLEMDNDNQPLHVCEVEVMGVKV